MKILNAARVVQEAKEWVLVLYGVFSSFLYLFRSVCFILPRPLFTCISPIGNLFSPTPSSESSTLSASISLWQRFQLGMHHAVCHFTIFVSFPQGYYSPPTFSLPHHASSTSILRACVTTRPHILDPATVIQYNSAYSDRVADSIPLLCLFGPFLFTGAMLPFIHTLCSNSVHPRMPISTHCVLDPNSALFHPSKFQQRTFFFFFVMRLISNLHSLV